jgi:hypothetical protein
MTEGQLSRSIARATGETVRLVRSRGFQPHTPRRHAIDPAPRLVVACPLCSGAVPYPGAAGSGVPLAECRDCDLLFGCPPTAVRLADGAARPGAPVV